MQTYKNLEAPIIFIGTGRSGTTIISEIISRHPNLAYPSNYNDRYPKSKYVNLIRLVFDNNVWRIFGQNKQLNKVPFFNKYYFKPSEAYSMWNYLTGESVDFSRGFLLNESMSEKRIDFIRNYFHSLVKLQNKERLMFKITGPSRITFLLKIFPDAIFINLTRDLIPTISSFLKVDFWQSRGVNRLWWLGAYDEKEKEWALKNSENGVLMTAFQLNKLNLVTKIERDKFQPNFLEISYEDFVAHPEKELESIIDFTNLPPMCLQKHLQKVKIFNRNKNYSEYFNSDELNKIRQIIQVK